MSSLEKEGPPVSKGIDRRQFLRTMFLGGGLLATGCATAAYGLSTPEKNSFAEGDEGSLFPGWIETKIEAPLIQPDKGHFRFLREAIFSHPILLDLTRDFYRYLDTNQEMGKRLLPGEALSYTFEAAYQAITERKWSAVKEGVDLPLEAVHTGVFSFAAGFFPWFSRKDLAAFNVHLKDKQTVLEYFFGREGLGTVTFPKLFGVEEGDDLDRKLISSGRAPRFAGQDRAVHFANHLFLTFNYLYAKHFHLPEEQTMPRILRLILSLAGGGSVEREAQLVSEISGRFYEILALQSWENWPFSKLNGKSIDEGPFEEMVEADYKGNRLGALTAIALWRRVQAGKSPEPLFEELNEEKFSRFETEPVLKA